MAVSFLAISREMLISYYVVEKCYHRCIGALVPHTWVQYLFPGGTRGTKHSNFSFRPLKVKQRIEVKSMHLHSKYNIHTDILADINNLAIFWLFIFFICLVHTPITLAFFIWPVISWRANFRYFRG